MEESTIILYYGIQCVDNYHMYCLQFFNREFTADWLKTDFAKFCIEDIDGSVYLGGILIDSPILGPTPPERLSGGTKTLLMAYNNKDRIFPLDNLGENCNKALYYSGIGAPTQWCWTGYSPDFYLNRESRLQIPV
ncbi:MAG: DUF4869 domain-containing protein [Lachnospiraceae bacterium]|nr:DUF4869 domain-containing protein [Lachnospiraceae bacterium]